jgi:hypothetical protein
METSILKSTKKVLGIPVDDISFDQDIMTFINSAFGNLTSLGLGPVEGFVVEDEDTDWDELGIDSVHILSLTKTCIYLRVRMMFDPPQTGFLVDSMNRQLQEHDWRLNQLREETEWVDPDPPVVLVDE